MQDDEARDYWERHARMTGEPYWILYPDGVIRDDTGRHPDFLSDGTRRPHTDFDWNAHNKQIRLLKAFKAPL